MIVSSGASGPSTTWKQTNLSRSATESSFNLDTDHNPSGPGSGDPLPGDHNIRLGNAFHARGYDTPYTAECTECHGQGLQGVRFDHGVIDAIDRQDDQLLARAQHVRVLRQVAVGPHDGFRFEAEFDGNLACGVAALYEPDFSEQSLALMEASFREAEAAVLAAALAERLVQLDAANAATYRANAEDFLRRGDEARAGWEEGAEAVVTQITASAGIDSPPSVTTWSTATAS